MEFDKKIFEQVCRSYVLDVINESKLLRSRLPLVEHAKIYDWTKNKASYNQIVSLIISEGSDKKVSKEAITEFEAMFEGTFVKKYPFQGSGKMLKTGAKGVWKLANLKIGTTIAAILLGRYIYKKLSDPCIRQCKLNTECIKNCRINSIKKTIDQLRSSASNCKDSKNPDKCVANIKKEIAKWNDKLITATSGRK